MASIGPRVRYFTLFKRSFKLTAMTIWLFLWLFDNLPVKTKVFKIKKKKNRNEADDFSG